MKTREIREIKQEIAGSAINSFEVHRLVQAYLYYHGYYETLEVFEKMCQFSRENAAILEKNPQKLQKNLEEEQHFNGGGDAEEHKFEEELQESEFPQEFRESVSQKTRQKDRDREFS